MTFRDPDAIQPARKYLPGNVEARNRAILAQMEEAAGRCLSRDGVERKRQRSEARRRELMRKAELLPARSKDIRSVRGSTAVVHQWDRQAWGKGIGRSHRPSLTVEVERTEAKGKRRRVYERDGWACVRCGTTDNLTLDHIRPIIHGGSDRFENLQTMCAPCNRQKGGSWDGRSGFPKG